MTEPQKEPEMEELEFLMSRYDRISESYMTTNQIIHNTFYISVVAIAGTAGVIPQLNDFRARTVLFISASFLFVAMYGWTKTYLNSRQELDKGTKRIVEIIEEVDYRFEHFSTTDFFNKTEEYNRAWWEPRKDAFLEYYYLGLATAAIFAMLIDVWTTLTGIGALSCGIT